MNKRKILITLTALVMCAVIVGAAVKSIGNFADYYRAYLKDTASVNTPSAESSQATQSYPMQENFKTCGDAFIKALNVGNKTVSTKDKFTLYEPNRTGKTEYCVESFAITKQCSFADKINIWDGIDLNLTDDNRITTDYSFILVNFKIKNLSDKPQTIYFNTFDMFLFDSDRNRLYSGDFYCTEAMGYNRNLEKAYRRDHFNYSIEGGKSDDIELFYIVKDAAIGKIEKMYMMLNPDGAGLPVSENIKFVKADFKIIK